MRFGVWTLGFEIWSLGLGFRVWGLGFSGLGVEGSGWFRVQGSGDGVHAIGASIGVDKVLQGFCKGWGRALWACRGCIGRNKDKKDIQLLGPWYTQRSEQSVLVTY